MIVRSNGSTENYPDNGSQPNDMSASNGTVVAIHNGAGVRIGVNGLETIATQRQLADLVAGAALRMGDNGIAIDRHGHVYVNQDFSIDRRGCTDVIVEIDQTGMCKRCGIPPWPVLVTDPSAARARSAARLGPALSPSWSPSRARFE